VFEIMSEIRENKLKANEITFNTLIDACVKGDNIELAFKYFSEMKEYNLKPDNFTYSSLIKGIKNYHTTLEREAKDTHIKQPKHKRMGEDFNTLEKVFEIFSACKEG
jgi:pentatricopeptide repeat protein